MKKLLNALIFSPIIILGQVVSDGTIKSNTNTLIRNANPVLRSNHSLINDQITDSKLARLENYSVSGTNTYTVSIAWVNSYSQGLTLPNLFFSNSSTGASTINVNGLGTKTVQIKGVGLSGGEIIANLPYTLIYDGTNFQLGSSTGTVTNPLIIGAELIAGGASSYNGSVSKTLGIQPTSVSNSMLVNPSINIAGNSTALGGSVTQDQITGLVSTGLVKRSAANSLIIASSGTDYAPATSGSSLLKANGAGGFSNAVAADVPGTANLAITNAMIAASTIDLTAKVTGLLPIANGGTGTASPGIVAGTNITVTGSWPNQTINSTGGGISGLTTTYLPLATSPTTLGNSEITKSSTGFYFINTNINGNAEFSVDNTSTLSNATSYLTAQAGTSEVDLISYGQNTSTPGLAELKNNSGDLKLTASGGNVNLTNANLKLLTAGNKIFITEGTNGSVGQTSLVSGVKAITISGTTTSTRCFITLVAQGGTVTTTVDYSCACTSNTVTITALTSAGATNTSDTSTLNYWLVN